MDIISGLSDVLLLKILLLVPTKVAVSTSILSKRWEYLWMSLPKLEFRDYSESECSRLRCFLDRNLPLHRAPVIESFRLELFCSCLNPENINMWVLTAVSHCLCELEILHDNTDPAKSNILPSNLYTCKSLVVLRLCGDILLDVPRMVSLPSLKTLELLSVRYFNGETLQRLLSSCPILEDLVLELRDNDTAGKFTVIVPSLQSFSLHIPYGHEIDGFVIETPSLECFKLKDDSRKDYYCLIENMPCLIEAHVECRCPDISSLIGSITSVKCLAICSEVLSSTNLNIWRYVYALFTPDQLIKLLKASSNLKRLDLSFIGHHESEDMDDWNQPTTVPECLLSSLQSLSCMKYTGEPQKRDIVVYILKHALHLKTATIQSSRSSYVTEFEMLKELALSTRASAACQLIFY